MSLFFEARTKGGVIWICDNLSFFISRRFPEAAGPNYLPKMLP